MDWDVSADKEVHGTVKWTSISIKGQKVNYLSPLIFLGKNNYFLTNRR